MSSFLVSLGFILAGSSVISSAVLARVAPPFTLTFYSLTLALAVLIPAGRRIPFRTLSVRDYAYFLGQGLTGILLFRVFLLVGLKTSTPWEAGLYMSFSPVFFVLLGRIILKEPWRKRYLLALGCVTISLVLLKTRDLQANTGVHWAGLFSLLAAQIAEALMTILRKKQDSLLPGIQHAFLVLLGAWLLLIPAALLELKTGVWLPVSAAETAAVVHYGLFATALAYTCWAAGTRKLSAARTGILSVLIPLSAQVLSVVFFRLDFGWIHGVAALFALAGLGMTLERQQAYPGTPA